MMFLPAEKGLQCGVEGVIAMIALVPCSDCPKLDSEIVKDCLAFRANVFVTFLEALVACHFSALQVLEEKTACDVKAVALRTEIASADLF